MDDTLWHRVARQSFPDPSDGLPRFDAPRHGGQEPGTCGVRLASGGAAAEHEQLDHFFAHAPELYGVGTLRGLILKVNAAWQRTLGYTPGELALTSLWDRVHPDARAACRSAAQALARAGGADIAVCMPHKDGSDRWVSWNLVVASGRLFAVGRDVTQRRRLEAGAATAPAVSSNLGPRVLLAEGKPDTQRAMSLRLTTAGFAVTLAPQGQAAVNLALAAQTAGRPYDTILMDMQTPVLDGYEATRTLRAAGYGHPIIAITAHASSEDHDECLRVGCDDHVAKPIDWPWLTRTIIKYSNQTPATR
jgi:PAS domain S-box-containing protein